MSNFKNVAEIFKNFDKWELIHNFTIKNTQMKLVFTNIIRIANVQFAVGLLLATASVLIDSHYLNEYNFKLMLQQIYIFKSMEKCCLMQQYCITLCM